jgi:D-glycero-alpha-D-manno-heptose 1-phosphate guanylyltransferase
MNFEAIVLAGGLGTRLREAVPDVPKALAPVAGRPFIDFLLDALAASGCARVILAVGHRHELISGHLGSKFAGLPLDYSVEDEPLGTGGASRKALNLVRAPSALLLNGDTWLDVDFQEMVAAHNSASAKSTIAVRAVPDVERYGAVEVESGRVSCFNEKGKRGPGLINAGTYVLERHVFNEFSLPQVFSLEHDFLIPHLPRLSPLAFRVTGTFIDIGTPDDYALAQTIFASPKLRRDGR